MFNFAWAAAAYPGGDSSSVPSNDQLLSLRLPQINYNLNLYLETWLPLGWNTSGTQSGFPEFSFGKPTALSPELGTGDFTLG